jgi:ribosome-binding factor A
MSRTPQTLPQGPTQRQLRVGEQIRHAIVEVLQRGRFHDEILLDAAHIVTVTEVRASPDLKNATVYTLRLGQGDIGDVLPALNEAAPYFQKELAKRLKMKFTPRLRFVSDDSFERANRIEELLHKLPKSSQKTTDIDEDEFE